MAKGIESMEPVADAAKERQASLFGLANQNGMYKL
jgi:hypothetical protein